MELYWNLIQKDDNGYVVMEHYFSGFTCCSCPLIVIIQIKSLSPTLGGVRTHVLWRSSCLGQRQEISAACNYWIWDIGMHRLSASYYYYPCKYWEKCIRKLALCWYSALDLISSPAIGYTRIARSRNFPGQSTKRRTCKSKQNLSKYSNCVVNLDI